MSTYTNALYSILLTPGQLERDAVIAHVWELGTIGLIEEGERHLRVFFEDLASVLAVQEVYSSVVDRVEEVAADPAHPSSDTWEPILVGSKFVIAPSCVEADVPQDRIRLTINSTISFGSGRHETTQLALAYLETLDLRGKRVLDIGCGSGILGIAALALGAASVVACDIDPLAVGCARVHSAAHLFVGSADAIATGCGDILLVNITARVIDSLAFELKRIVKPGGRVMMTGFLLDHTPGCFSPQEAAQAGEWLRWTGISSNFNAGEQAPGYIFHHAQQWW